MVQGRLIVCVACATATTAMAQPINDECTTPINIDGAGSFFFDSLGATTNPNAGQGFERFETGLGFNEIRKDVWYAWTADKTGHAKLQIDFAEGISIPKAAVYDAIACPPFEEDILDAQHDVFGEASLRFNVHEGQQYLIQIGSGDAGDGRDGIGAFSITIDDPTGTCCTGDGAVEVLEKACEGDYLGDFVEAVTYEVESIPFDFEDISAFGQELSPGLVDVDFGFPFPFYNEIVQGAVFSSKGYLSLGAPAGEETTFSTILPDITKPNALIAALWSNWTTGDGPNAQPGELHVATLGTPGVDLRFIAQWTNLSEPVVFGPPAGDTTFQAVLFEDGSIEYHWLQVESMNNAGFGGRLTAGIENAEGRRFVNIGNLFGIDATAVRISPTLACEVTCPADVNGDGELSILDFIAFQALFTAGDAGADCDQSGTLDVLDFICFQAIFQNGCM